MDRVNIYSFNLKVDQISAELKESEVEKRQDDNEENDDSKADGAAKIIVDLDNLAKKGNPSYIRYKEVFRTNKI